MDRQSYENAPDASLDKLLRQYCRLPQPLLSADELDRLEHTDLASRSLSSLLSELEALKLWLPVCRPQHPWYRERVRRLREAIRRAS
jgi:hypothetical protein